MKRVFSHPPEEQQGRRYWRSVGELSDTPEFRSWLEREFPAGAAQLNGDEWSRRGFLKLMGASMALAGFGFTSCRRPEAHLVPFTKTPEWAIPGKALYYATAMPRRAGAMPLIVTTVDGRPIKVEGNPLHPSSGGATDAFAQASVLDLYDPTRTKQYLHHGKKTDRATFEKYLNELSAKLGADGGAGLAFLVEETHSPTRERLRAELETRFPRMRWCVYDPLLSEAQNFGTQISFGDNSRLIPRFESADVVLALDSDFLDCGQGDLSAIRGFTSRRRVGGPKDSMNRLYVVENRFSLTGAMADHRLRLPASQIPAFTHALAMKIAGATQDTGLGATLATLKAPEGKLPWEAKWLDEMAADLMAKPGASLVLAGPHQPVVVQLMVYGINSALKNVGTTLMVKEIRRNARTNSILQLANEMAAGRIKQLFILGGDPVYNAPRALAAEAGSKGQVDWAHLQKKVPEVVRLGYHRDATTEMSQWQVPMTHYLESWGDALTHDGSYVAIQPMILPIYDGMSELDLINGLLGRPPVEGPELVQETFRAQVPVGGMAGAGAWHKFLRDGFAAGVGAKDRTATFNGNTAGGVAHTLWAPTPAPTAESPEIVFVGSYAIDDGRYINNGWLQELPDPITKLTWDNAAMMSPALAKSLGVATGDLIEITVTEKTTDAQGQKNRRQLVIAALVAPGHVDNSITIPLGYGRSVGQHGALPYAGAEISEHGPAGDSSGFNGYYLRTASNPHFITVDGRGIESIKVGKVGRKYPLSITQDHWSIEGRGLVREATVEQFRKDPGFVKKVAGDDHLPAKLPSLYRNPPLDAQHQWGMAVDLNVCTGCSSCVVACQAENNIPIVGKLQVSHSRAMHWLRIDRYFASAQPYNADRGEYPTDPEMVHQPMMCQHCENAPCETVCPVNATVHSEDGLNVMAYNRCIGTRYCANNCPFKVRRFNYFDYNQRPVGKKKIAGEFGVYQEYLGPLTDKGTPDTIKMRANPNVTVRMRGVMEKCTYCVQRIQEAKIAAQVRAGASPNTRIPADAFTSACAQACPTNAIVFGDIANPESQVSKIKEQERNYRLLEYLNVKTRTSYLARLRNPNPKMPDAHKSAQASADAMHGAGHKNGHGAGHGTGHADYEGIDFQGHNPGTLNPQATPDMKSGPSIEDKH